MKKLERKSNFHIVVYPRRLGNLGCMRVPDSAVSSDIESDYLDRCKEIADAIKRHADNVGETEIKYDQLYVCEHCGNQWTEDSDTYNGGCCDKDEENNPCKES